MPEASFPDRIWNVKTGIPASLATPGLAGPGGGSSASEPRAGPRVGRWLPRGGHYRCDGFNVVCMNLVDVVDNGFTFSENHCKRVETIDA